MEAISRASKCQQYLFSVSLNPPQGESVGAEVFEDALDRIEKRLGLEDQPRAVVFHEKENRRHAHCVWSRMDDETLTARQLSFFKTKLMGISRDLYLDNGWIARQRAEAQATEQLETMLIGNPSGSLGDAKINDKDSLKKSGLVK